MKFLPTKLPGVTRLQGQPFVDERGLFCRLTCEKEFEEQGINFVIRQSNISENRFKHTLRGFHYQIKPFEEAKILTPLRGALYDVVVDFRRESPTFLQWESFELDSGKRDALYVPKGCLNAWLTLADETMVHYNMSEFFAPQASRGVRYNDPHFCFTWPCEPAIISEKDLSYPDFDPASPA